MSKDNGKKETGLIEAVSHQLCPEIDPKQFMSTLKDMCCKGVKGGVSNEELAGFLMVCREHNLNPIMKEIYPFRDGRGGFQCVVGIDGWMKLANSHPQFDGMDIIDNVNDDGQPISCTAKIYRKDRQHPMSVTEWLAECNMNTKPWQDRPIRMLRHKATIQAIRYAFALAGIIDPEEAREIVDIKEVQHEQDRLTIGPMRLEVEASRAGVTVQELEECSQEVYKKSYKHLTPDEATNALNIAINYQDGLTPDTDVGDTGDISTSHHNMDQPAEMISSDQEDLPL